MSVKCSQTFSFHFPVLWRVRRAFAAFSPFLLRFPSSCEEEACTLEGEASLRQGERKVNMNSCPIFLPSQLVFMDFSERLRSIEVFFYFFPVFALIELILRLTVQLFQNFRSTVPGRYHSTYVQRKA